MSNFVYLLAVILNGSSTFNEKKYNFAQSIGIIYISYWYQVPIWNNKIVIVKLVSTKYIKRFIIIASIPFNKLSWLISFS